MSTPKDMPKAVGGIGGWVDDRIRAGVREFYHLVRADLPDSVREAMHAEMGLLPGQTATLVTAGLPPVLRPLVGDEIRGVMPDVLSGNFGQIPGDAARAAEQAVKDSLGPFLGTLAAIEQLLGNLPHLPGIPGFPGFGIERRDGPQ
jgi:hypothetical protein